MDSRLWNTSAQTLFIVYFCRCCLSKRKKREESAAAHWCFKLYSPYNFGYYKVRCHRVFFLASWSPVMRNNSNVSAVWMCIAKCKHKRYYSFLEKLLRTIKRPTKFWDIILSQDNSGRGREMGSRGQKKFCCDFFN
jgi:hypothetical protein